MYISYKICPGGCGHKSRLGGSFNPCIGVGNDISNV